MQLSPKFLSPKFQAGDLHAARATVDTPLNQLNEPELVPGAAALARINADLR